MKSNALFIVYFLWHFFLSFDLSFYCFYSDCYSFCFVCLFTFLYHSYSFKYFNFYFFVPCGKFGSPYLGKAQQPQEQLYPFLSVCAVFSCVQTMVWLPVFGIFNVCAQMMMHTIAHGGWTDSIRESALEVDSGRKIPCRTGDSNLRQYCALVFSRTLYPLSYPHPIQLFSICAQHRYCLRDIMEYRLVSRLGKIGTIIDP